MRLDIYSRILDLSCIYCEILWRYALTLQKLAVSAVELHQAIDDDVAQTRRIQPQSVPGTTSLLNGGLLQLAPLCLQGV